MIAFGGVATGIMKAADAPIVVTNSTCSVGIPRTGAAAARSGSIVAAKAVLEVNSVAKITRVATPKTTSTGGRPTKAVA